jgi:hypothetical protein
MNPPDDPLDLLLKEQETYIEDGGFTARVMTSLPKRKRGLTLRSLLLGGTALAGFALAGWLLLGTDFFAIGQLGQGLQLGPFLLALMPVVVAVIAIIWGIVAGFNEEG